MTIGLRYKKLDLHLHTKASHDFHGNISPNDIVEAAIQKGLDGIAITDHNTGAWIDLVSAAAQHKNLTIFPGVEISCSGGEKGIHIVALFDPSKNSSHVTGLLSALGILPEHHGKPDCIVNKSVIDVIEMIDRWGGLPVLAHANSTKGVLCDMRGEQRTQIIKHSKLLAVEATDCLKSGKRTMDILDGTDPVYQRKLAVYQASDNPSSSGQEGHSLESIGTRCTFFKLDIINLEGLRQCFVHPDARIKIQHQSANYNKILRLAIGETGFLKNQVFDFHEGLNSIIGGKGVGKSLAVEFLRFGLSDHTIDQDMLTDHCKKLEKQLGLGNTVEVIYELESGNRYQIRRHLTKVTSNSKIESVVECVNCETGEKYYGDIHEMFPILAYSQTEVIKISENKNAQLELIDKFIDKRPFVQGIEQLKEKLRENDLHLAKAIAAKDRVEQIDHQIHTLQERIVNINKALSNELFDLMKTKEAKRRILENGIEKIQNLNNSVKELINDIALPQNSNESSPKQEDEDIELVKQNDIISLALRNMVDILNKLMEDLVSSQDSAKVILTEWLVEFNTTKAEYDRLISDMGGDKRKQEHERQKLENEQAELAKTVQQFRDLANSLNKTQQERESLLAEMEQLYRGYFETRKTKFDELSAKSEGKLQLLLEHAQNNEKYSGQLVELLKGGTNALTPAQRKQIAEKISSRRFVNLVLSRDVEALSQESDLTYNLAQKAIEKLWSHDDFAEVLALQHDCYPQDVPKIQFCKAHGHYAELSELSIGQKCTALLIIALSEGNIPVIIDQPEDALDIVSVWEDIAKKLLGRKHSRQFILTTHNSSVAVAADSDQFIIMQGDATEGAIVAKGAIDRDEVKKAVLSHLEGGREPYNLRRRKYNQDDPF